MFVHLYSREGIRILLCARPLREEERRGSERREGGEERKMREGERVGGSERRGKEGSKEI